ncbi:hypothetical protein DXG01_002409 [Tephrocybe rancida]|nr:hypothetical protein DXG01_002409 [Tephrocybe rancida]
MWRQRAYLSKPDMPKSWKVQTSWEDAHKESGVEEEVVPQGEEEETLLEGSQYSSDGEQYEIEEYEDFELDERDEEGYYEHMYGLRSETMTSDDEVPEIQEVSDSEYKSDEEEVNEEFFVGVRESGQTERKAKRYVEVRKSSRKLERPPRMVEECRCFMTLIEINGLKAFTLFDSGCTIDAVSPEFARVANVKVHPLEALQATPWDTYLG